MGESRLTPPTFARYQDGIFSQKKLSLTTFKNLLSDAWKEKPWTFNNNYEQ